MKNFLLTSILYVGATIFGIYVGGKLEFENNPTPQRIKKKEVVFVEPIKADTNTLNAESLRCYLEEIGVHHVDIVVKQAILETGWFTSYSCTHRNNLFGLTNGKTKQLFEFDHWRASCVGYRDMVQYKYKGGDYYQFLVDMHYASDPNYINKLKHIKYD
jgi:hypothetical protein